MTASGKVAPAGVGAVGTVKLAVDSDSGERKLVLKDFISGLPCNLFSTLQLLLSGGRIDSRSGGIFDKSDVNIASISTTTDGLSLDVLGRGPHFGRPYQLKLPRTLSTRTSDAPQLLIENYEGFGQRRDVVILGKRSSCFSDGITDILLTHIYRK